MTQRSQKELIVIYDSAIAPLRAVYIPRSHLLIINPKRGTDVVK